MKTRNPAPPTPEEVEAVRAAERGPVDTAKASEMLLCLLEGNGSRFMDLTYKLEMLRYYLDREAEDGDEKELAAFFLVEDAMRALRDVRREIGSAKRYITGHRQLEADEEE